MTPPLRPGGSPTPLVGGPGVWVHTLFPKGALTGRFEATLCGLWSLQLRHSNFSHVDTKHAGPVSPESALAVGVRFRPAPVKHPGGSEAGGPQTCFVEGCFHLPALGLHTVLSESEKLKIRSIHFMEQNPLLYFLIGDEGVHGLQGRGVALEFWAW